MDNKFTELEYKAMKYLEETDGKQFEQWEILSMFAEAYHQEESKELIISDNNGKGWFNSYQEVDLFLFQEIDDFPIINEKTPEANTIEAIKIYAKLHAEAYHQEKMKEAIKENNAKMGIYDRSYLSPDFLTIIDNIEKSIKKN
jgi:late competence protein required for DNA uptake (superfamily II DNA/RNA helicase)